MDGRVTVTKTQEALREVRTEEASPLLEDAIRQSLAVIGEIAVESELEVGAAVHGATSSAAPTDRDSASSAARIARWA